MSSAWSITSNRGPDEWLATFADPVRAQSAIDRFTSASYDMVIEGESYRRRLKPKLVGDTAAPRLAPVPNTKTSRHRTPDRRPTRPNA